MKRSAHISGDGRYRYTLTRDGEWGDGERVCWVMLNPSTADADTDDATIRRVVGFSQRWGYGSAVVVNLCAIRSTDPKAVLRSDAVGPSNRHWVLAEARDRDVIVACGNGAEPIKVYANELLSRVQEVARSVSSLGETALGWPRHPVRLSYEAERQTWPPPW